jgi:hypothetical protein
MNIRTSYHFNREKNTFAVQLNNNHNKTRITASVVWWSGFLATDSEVRLQFPTLSDFLRSSGSGTVSSQRREYNSVVS